MNKMLERRCLYNRLGATGYLQLLFEVPSGQHQAAYFSRGTALRVARFPRAVSVSVGNVDR